MSPVFSARNSFRALAIPLALATMTIASSAHAAIFVRFDGIDGASLDSTHRGWCDVTSFTREVSATIASGTVRRGSPQFSAITLVHEMDKASAKLEEAVARGLVIPTVTIEVTGSYGGTRQVYYRLQLTNVQITRYALTSPSPESPPVEEIALIFERVNVTYVDIGRDGRSRGNIEYSWTVPTAR